MEDGCLNNRLHRSFWTAEHKAQDVEHRISTVEVVFGRDCLPLKKFYLFVCHLRSYLCIKRPTSSTKYRFCTWRRRRKCLMLDVKEYASINEWVNQRQRLKSRGRLPPFRGEEDMGKLLQVWSLWPIARFKSQTNKWKQETLLSPVRALILIWQASLDQILNAWVSSLNYTEPQSRLQKKHSP